MPEGVSSRYRPEYRTRSFGAFLRNDPDLAALALPPKHEKARARDDQCAYQDANGRDFLEEDETQSGSPDHGDIIKSRDDRGVGETIGMRHQDLPGAAQDADQRQGPELQSGRYYELLA